MFRPAGKDYGKPVRELAMPQVSDEEVESYQRLEELIAAAEKLLEWMPIYPTGSTAYLRRSRLRKAIDACRGRK